MVNSCFPTGKKLPGNKHLAALSARQEDRGKLPKRLINHDF